MNHTRRWLATFPPGPPRYSAIDVLAWLLCGWSLIYAALLRFVPSMLEPWQPSIRYAPIVVMLGSSVILLAALWQAHPAHGPPYRLACSALLLTQVLDIGAIALEIRPFVIGSLPQVSVGFPVYVLVYISLICSVGFFVPFWRFPQIPVLRATLDSALLVAITDLLLRLFLPAIVPTWQWNAPLLACAFRLESTIGLFFWYTRLFFRFGDATVVPIRLWLLGFGCLLVNDAIVLWATFLVQSEQELVRAAIPFWMLNQTLWALALYRNRHTPTLWRDHTLLSPSAFYPPLWQQVVRLVVTLSTLVVVVATGPALTSVLWFFSALMSRELLTLFERERVLEAERTTHESLAVTNRELETTNAELRRTEDERSRVTEQLRQLSDLQAQQLEQRQIRAAEVAHDIGNLLQPARVSIALADEALEGLDPAIATELRGYLATMEENVLMSENLLKTIVAAARLDAGVLTLNMSLIAIESLLARVVRYQQSRDLRPPVEIKLDLPASLPPVPGDEALLMRAVLNLVGNAVKYTSAARADGSGKVIVEARASDGHVQIVVRDNGPGIAPEVLDRLGRPFVRGVDEPSAPAGFGLGLAFSRGVIEQHPGGALRLTSVAGEGTEVTIILPPVVKVAPPRSRAFGTSRDDENPGDS